MKHTTHTRSSRASFVQAVLLIVILIVGYLGYSILSKGEITSGLNALVNMDVQNMHPLKSMEEDKKRALQQTFGGFWISETEDSLAPIQKHDCLELRDNGIIWQVISWRVTYPSGEIDTIFHIRHGYLKPYSTAGNGTDIVCEVRTIRQIYINDNDTCFGASQVDELWQTRKNDTLLVMNRKKYLPYHGELSNFFPEGMIDLIDKLIVEDCRRAQSPAVIVKEKLKNYYQRAEMKKTSDPLRITQSLSFYFESAYIDEIFSTIPYFPILPDSIIVPISCDNKGRLEVIISKNKKARLHHFNAMIINELEMWPVPPVSGDEPKTIKYSIILPPP